MKYNIATAGNEFDLIKFVNRRIDEGWSPIGGVSVCHQNDGSMVSRTIYLQAMVKRQEFKQFNIFDSDNDPLAEYKDDPDGVPF